MSGYRIVSGGVSRGRTALKRPSTKALVLDGRHGASRAAFRRGAVPSDVRKGHVAAVAKAVSVPDTRQEEIAQLGRKRKLTRVNTTAAGLGGVATIGGALSAVPRVRQVKGLKHLGRASGGVAGAAGVVGTYGALRGAKVTATDLDIQRKKLGVSKVSKGMPTVLTAPRGLIKPKVYRASGIRTTTTGRLYRTRANVG